MNVKYSLETVVLLTDKWFAWLQRLFMSNEFSDWCRVLDLVHYNKAITKYFWYYPCIAKCCFNIHLELLKITKQTQLFCTLQSTLYDGHDGAWQTAGKYLIWNTVKLIFVSFTLHVLTISILSNMYFITQYMNSLHVLALWCHHQRVSARKVHQPTCKYVFWPFL
jgi:hypothetical protein